jgi:hypothetical protein
VIVAFVGGVTVVPPPPQPLMQLRLRSQNARAEAGNRFVCPPAIPTQASRTARTVPDRSGIRERRGMRGILGVGVSPSTAATFEVLETLTVNAYEEDPFGGTTAGKMEQLVEPGVPAQRSETMPLKPPSGETWRL